MLTTFSVFIVIAPVPTLIAFVIFVIIVFCTKYVSLGSITAAAALPVIIFFLGDKLWSQGGFGPVFYLTLAGALLIIVRHHANIVRLFKGTESKLSLKGKK